MCQILENGFVIDLFLTGLLHFLSICLFPLHSISRNYSALPQQEDCDDDIKSKESIIRYKGNVEWEI